MATARRFARQWQQRHGSSSSAGQWQQSHGTAVAVAAVAAPQQRVASLIDNYFVTSSTQPHTWVYGKVNEVTGFASHARVNIPSDTTTIEEFGESLRRHPKVLRVEAQRNHQSDFN